MLGALFWGYSGYSYSGLRITEYTEFQFRKERSLCFKSGNEALLGGRGEVQLSLIPVNLGAFIPYL